MTTTEPRVDEFLHVDPAELAFGPNVRTDLDIDQEFTDSIREHGVLETITCYRGDAGQLVVYRGNRRAWTAATVHAEDGEHLTWHTVPVRVIPAPDDDADRITRQYVENRHRRDMATADAAAAVEQLALVGVQPGDIARRLSVPRDHVDRLASVAAAPAARAAAAEYELTVDQAAGIAEFADDPKTVDTLTHAVGRGQFDHALATARHQRRTAEEIAALTAELKAAKVKLLKERPGYNSPIEPIDDFGITTEQHATCPGNRALVGQISRYVDGRHEHGVGARYYCADPKQYGHKKKRAPKPSDTRTEEQAEKERAAARRVRDLNAAWRTAQGVRRRWLHELAQRANRVPLAGAEAFIVGSLLGCDYSIAAAMESGRQWQLFRDLMGLAVDPVGSNEARQAAAPEREQLIGRIGAMPAKRQTHLTAVALLCAWEDLADVHLWRAAEHHPDRADERAVRNLRQMETWGYALSPVERLAAGYDVDEADLMPGDGE